MVSTRPKLSNSETRREAVIGSAVAVFANQGYLGTPVTDVAAHAKISPAYVFKLFPRKEDLFTAALERCFTLIEAALAQGAEGSQDQSPEALLYAMGGAYAALIADRNLLSLQIHAQSAAHVPEIAKAFRNGLQRITEFVQTRSHASDEAVQRFMAYGQLCHLITIMNLDQDQSAWARTLTGGMRHR